MDLHQNRLTRPSHPTRVTHLAFSLQVGGMEKLLVEFARHADADHFSPDFISLTDAGSPADEIRRLGAHVTCLDKATGFRWNTVKQLVQHFRSRGTQVVHTHNSGAMIYGALAARLAGVPVVVHTRHGQRLGATRRQNRAFRNVARMVDRVVGVSRDSTNLTTQEGVSPQNSSTIWNGIDTSRYPYHGPVSNAPALVVARLAPEKDFTLLFQAVAFVLERHPDFQLFIAGDGPRRVELERAIATNGLSTTIKLLGERNDIPQLLRNASQFILPSKSEGVSLTLLEAMSTGLPCIATDVGGNSEVVLPGETGLLTPRGDARSMAAAICHILDSPTQAIELGFQGRLRVEQHFEIRRMVAKYESLYTNLISTASPQLNRRRTPLSLAYALSPSLRNRRRSPAVANG